jgi:hypothetical protein
MRPFWSRHSSEAGRYPEVSAATASDDPSPSRALLLHVNHFHFDTHICELRRQLYFAQEPHTSDGHRMFAHAVGVGAIGYQLGMSTSSELSLVAKPFPSWLAPTDLA